MEILQRIELWRVRDLVPHPDNPRVVNVKSPKFADLVASIEANGVLEPLVVRRIPGNGAEEQTREVLSGHRRLAAAVKLGLHEVPVRDLGDCDDRYAYDLVAMSNLHEDLTPLEEGRRAACWLDKYGGDVEAVASKLGKTASWVAQHAQIARGLSAEWQQAATELEMLDRWTASHWAVIARLPAAIQAKELAKFRNGAYSSYDRWSVKELEDRIKIEMLYLASAPFDDGTCRECIDRTDRQPLLWGDVVEQNTGDKARCLNKKCWDKKAAAFARRQFLDVCKQKGVASATPISLLTPPKDWYSGGTKYEETIRGLKRQYKGLLTADQYELVEQEVSGAEPAIVVAGGKGKQQWSLKYICRRATKVSALQTVRPISAAELAERDERDRDAAREDEATRLMIGEILDGPRPSLPAMTVFLMVWFGEVNDWLNRFEARRTQGSDEGLWEWVGEAAWLEMQETLRKAAAWIDKTGGWNCLEGAEWDVIGRMFGVDRPAIKARIVADEARIDASEKREAAEATDGTEKEKKLAKKKPAKKRRPSGRSE